VTANSWLRADEVAADLLSLVGTRP
jgi:hypothetical protein